MEFKTKVQSSVSLYWFGRYALYAVPILMLYGLASSFLPYEGEPTRTTLLGIDLLWFWRALLCYMAVKMVLVARGWRRIEYTWDFFLVQAGGDKKKYRWNELKSVSKVPFVTPPIYQVKFKNNDKPVYFSMSWRCGTFGFWSWDRSGFYEFAKNWIKIDKENKAPTPNQPVRK